MPTLTLSYTGTTTSITREYNRLIAFVSGPPGAPGPSGANGLDGTGVFSFSGYLTTGQADLRYYPLDSNPSGYINTFEFTGLSGYLDSLIQNSSNGVSSVNGLTGILNIIGTGNVFVTLGGSNIIISGSGSNASVDFSGYITTGEADSRYYSINNPSGFITGVDTGYLTGYLPRSETGQFASQTNLGLTGTTLLNLIGQTGDSLQTQINLINSNTGNFYLNSNPSGFITGVDTGYLTGYLPRSETGQLVSNLATQTQLTLTGQTLSNQIGAITGTTGLFYLRSNPSGFITNFELTGASGDLQIQITNLNGVTGSFYLSSNPSGYITNFALTGASGVLQDYINIINSTTGIFITTGQTGQFALQNTLTGLSGYLVGLIGASSAGVASLNGLSGVLNIQGAGNVFITNVGQNIIISGSGSQANVDLSGYITTGQADLRYYPLGSNPSGYLINFNLTGASGALQQQISNINNNTGQFYLNSNPSGYITGFSSGNYITTGQTGQFASYVLVTGLSGQLVNDLATKVQLTLTGQTLSNQISQITGATGLFYLNSNPSGFITGFDSGNYVRRSETGQFAAVSLVTGLSGQFVTDFATKNQLTLTGQTLFNQISQITGATGLFYLNSNPSGFITNVNLTGASGALQIQITNVNNITGSFYLNTNPSGYITNFNLTGASGALQTAINLINSTTGIFITTGQTGQFASQTVLNNFSGYIISLIDAASAGVSSLNGASGTVTLVGAGNVFITTVGQTITISGSGTQPNLSGYITTGDADSRYYPLGSNPSGYLINFNLTGASGVLQAQINSINGNTGNFYLNSNPSGYITGFSSGNYITTGQTGQFASYVLVTGLSGQLTNDLATKVQLTLTGQTLLAQIGELTGTTGLFYLRSNPSGFITNFNLTGASGALQVQVNSLNGVTGSFYLSSNPSGYIRNFELTGASGALQSAINAINSVTGIFITTGQTGQFASQYALTGLSGYLTNLISSSIDGVTGINGLTGAVYLQGLGNVFVSINGQNIIFSGSGTSLNLSPKSLAYQDADAVLISGGEIDGTAIGNTTPNSGRFSTLNVEDNTSLASVGGDVSVGTLDKVGKLHVRGNQLGEFENDSIVILNLSNLNDNENIIQFKQFRHTSGQGWANATTRIQQITDVTEQGYIDFNPIGNPSLAFGHNGTEIVRITETGFIGINTTTPGATLEIKYDNGTPESFVSLRLTEGFGSVESWDLRVYNGYPSGAGQIGVFGIHNVSTNQTPIIINQSDFVGIGAEVPTAKLHTSGTLRFEGFADTGFLKVDNLGNVSIDNNFYATVSDLYQTGSSLSIRIDQITNSTGLFYLNSNPSGFITNINLSGASGVLQSQINNVSTSVSSLSGFTINISGYLQSQINSSSAVSGNTQFESRLETIPQSVNRHSVVFSQSFNLIPIVIGNIVYTGSDLIIPNIASVSNTGFDLIFSESTLLNNYKFNFIALSGNLYNVSGGFAGVAGITSLNSTTGAVNLVQAGNVFISVAGQNITISGSGSSAGSTFDPSGYITTGQADLRYYPLNSNPSGYLTNFNLTGASGALQGQIITLTGFLRESDLRNSGIFLREQYLQSTGANGITFSYASGFVYNKANGRIFWDIFGGYFYDVLNNTIAWDLLNYSLNYSNGGPAMVWSVANAESYLYDRTGLESLDFHNRLLHRDDFEVSLDWNQRGLSGDWRLDDSSIVNLTALQSYSGQIRNYVNSISGAVKTLTATGISVSGNVGISGIGGTQVFIVGNSIIISGGAGGGGAGDVTFAQLTGASGALQAQINSISSSGSSTVPFNLYLAKISISIDAGTNTIETGFKGYFEATSDMTISGWNIVANRTGTVLIDLFKTTYNNFSSFGSIITGIPPSLNNQNKSYGNVMTGWNIGVSRGDILEFVVKGCTGINKININITGTKNE